MTAKNLSKKIRKFWEKNPFHMYESPYELRTKEFFEYSDFIKETDTEKYSRHLWRFNDFRGKKVLDIGFASTGWLVRNYARNGAIVFGIDLTDAAVTSVKKGLKIYNLNAKLLRADAKKLPFRDNSFDFVSSLGTLHHTGNTKKCVDEIFRVLKPGGNTTIALYHRGLLFNRQLFPLILLLIRLFLDVKGRENMKLAKSPEELIRYLDGNDNPFTEMFSKKEIDRLFTRFNIKNTECHEFPIHFTRIPKFLHMPLDHFLGLMIYIQAEKPR